MQTSDFTGFQMMAWRSIELGDGEVYPAVFVFADNWDDYRRPENTDRQIWDDASKYCGHFDQWFCRGIILSSKHIIEDWDRVIRDCFKPLKVAIRNGIDVVIRSPSKDEVNKFSQLLINERNEVCIDHFYEVEKAANGDMLARHKMEIIQHYVQDLAYSASKVLKIIDDGVAYKPNFDYVNLSEFYNWPSKRFKQALIQSAEIDKDDNYSVLNEDRDDSTMAENRSSAQPSQTVPLTTYSLSQTSQQYMARVGSQDDIDINMGMNDYNDNEFQFDDNQPGSAPPPHGRSISPIQHQHAHGHNVHDPMSDGIPKHLVIDKLKQAIHGVYDGHIFDDNHILDKLLETCMIIIII